MSWHTIDLGHSGPRGIEGRFRIDGVVTTCYIHGSDHTADWLHHVLPGARRREVAAAKEIAEILSSAQGRIVIAGHSLGGCVATIAAHILRYEYDKRVSLITYGGKRAPKKYYHPGIHMRHRGDIVPFFPPWRPAQKPESVFGKRLLPNHAHGPDTYYKHMRCDGVR